MKKSVINTAVAAALAASAGSASATISTFNWNGVFTLLDSTGVAQANSSIPGKSTFKFQTNISGTMAFDNVTNAGTATVVPFQFFNGNPTLPATAAGITMQAIGDGMGGAGSLVLGNMLFNWNTTNGIPVSLVIDAAGFFGATSGMFGDGVLDGTDVAGFGATPASDGTYTGATFGYLNLGPIPMASLSQNTTNRIGCGSNDGTCLGNASSGVLPLVVDTAPNPNDFDLTTPTYSDLANDGVGGSPMQDGPFPNFNANFDVTELMPTGTSAGTIGPFDVGPEIPVPAAVWLFGSGLLGLVGVARRKKSEV